jgi:hypothetical protein
MAIATSTPKPTWRAEVTARERKIIEEFVEVTRPNSDRVVIRFRVNRRDRRVVSFTDYREQNTGTAGTAGIWGTLQPQPAGKRRSLGPATFQAELARLAGAERAKEILESLDG